MISIIWMPPRGYAPPAFMIKGPGFKMYLRESVGHARAEVERMTGFTAPWLPNARRIRGALFKSFNMVGSSKPVQLELHLPV